MPDTPSSGATTINARIETELAPPGTIGVRSNSTRFDDEVTRFLF